MEVIKFRFRFKCENYGGICDGQDFPGGIKPVPENKYLSENTNDGWKFFYEEIKWVESRIADKYDHV